MNPPPKPADRGLTATFKDAAGKEIAKVSLGKNIESGAAPSPMGGSNSVGRYVRNHADESGFYAVSEMFTSVSDEAPRWLDSGFISPEKIKSITLSQVGKTDPAWKLTRDGETAEFQLDGAAATEVLDTAATGPLKSLFSYARFEDVVPAANVAGRAAEGKRTATIETFEGFTYTVNITPTKPGTPPAASSPDAAPPATDNYLVTVDVAATLPKERKKEDGEKPEDAKTKDTAFADRLKIPHRKTRQGKSLRRHHLRGRQEQRRVHSSRSAKPSSPRPSHPTADAPAPHPEPESKATPAAWSTQPARHRHHSAHRSCHPANLCATCQRGQGKAQGQVSQPEREIHSARLLKSETGRQIRSPERNQTQAADFPELGARWEFGQSHG